MYNRYAVIVPLVALVWGGSFIAVKVAVGGLSPILLALLRFALASPAMLGIALLKRKSLVIHVKDVPAVVLLALTGVTLLYVFQFTGIKYTTATSAALLINTNVLFIAILSAILLKEVLSRKKIFGVICGFLGAALIVTNGSLLVTRSFGGDMLIILSALCWAVYSVAGKKVMERYDPITINTHVFFLGTLLLVPFAFRDMAGATVSGEAWAIIVYLALACSVFGYVAWYDALARMDATKVAIFLNLIPLFAILIAHVVLHERITTVTVIGAALILYAIYLTEKG
ncbi:MAG: DMT family transporter [Thermoplasmata archaeon]|nr:MAG: DMT family transporter [Thermoplasmata archaeon]